MSDPAVSVIALFDRGEFEPCLSSLLAQTGVEFELLAVVGDESAAARAPKDERIRCIVVSDRNPALRRNAAAAKAQGRILAFIDDDATAPPDWLAHGLEFLDSNPHVAGVGGPNLCPANANLRELLTDMVLTAPLIGAGSRAYRGGGWTAPAKPGELHLVNFLVRRDCFDRVGGFNEALGYGGEDTEFIYQASRLGAKFAFDPSLRVPHRRRPFGLSYFRQRFHLRRQSAKLFVAYPRIYARSLSFYLAVLALPALIGVSVLSAWLTQDKNWIIEFGGLYLTIIWAWAFCSKQSWSIILLAPLVFFLHHLANLAGLWFGFTEALFSPSPRRRSKG
jgi:GT2 family glycosyltransferase